MTFKHIAYLECLSFLIPVIVIFFSPAANQVNYLRKPLNISTAVEPKTLCLLPICSCQRLLILAAF